MTPTNDPKADWLNMVAHDLKTPINSVRGCIELVQQLGPLTERQKHFADKAMAGLQRMEHLVARLLEISWIDANVELDLVECDLKVIVHDVVDMLRQVAERRNITFHVEIAENMELVTADAGRLTQVVDNLVSNAVKYNRDGGEVWIKAVQETDRVVVSVRDTGMGISKEDQARVFERFFRAREGVAQKIEGSGLGLAISKAIVQKHGGRIWLESKSGKGSTFYFVLPLQDEISEGGDLVSELDSTVGESAERRERRVTEVASEEHDGLSDDVQEEREIPQTDSSSRDEP
ncbi:MAG TPA: HAMP domain-containing sensor histidine kinase [Phototrophicaceae bacterium]|nr:HAMP domain-containing sensor histidine kinase [Phototrophicaceae bacterium]